MMEQNSAQPGVLDGIRVLDLTRYQAGPACTVMLADMGADVIKVETPQRGDEGRHVFRDQEDEIGAYFLAMNHGKRSITVDFRAAAGRELLLELVRNCDVVVENFRPGTAAALGLGYEHCRAVNDHVIYASASAFGEEGPMAGMAGFDIHAQAVGGIMSTTGSDDDNAYPVGAAIGDQTAGMTLCTAVLGALLARERFGVGQRVSVSLYGCQMALQSWEIGQYAKTRRLPGKGGTSHPTVGSTGVVWSSYATQDGHITLGVLGPKQQQAFVAAIGLGEVGDAEDFMLDASHLQDQIRQRIAEQTTDAWIAELSAQDIHVGRVNDYADIVADPQAWANDYLVDIEHTDGRRYTVVGSPIRYSKTPARIRASAPALGEHTDAVLADAGVGPAEIARLREQGVI